MSAIQQITHTETSGATQPSCDATIVRALPLEGSHRTNSEALIVWNEFVESHKDKKGFYDIGQYVLYDPERYAFWKSLIVENKKTADEKWKGKDPRRNRVTDVLERFYPATALYSGNHLVGFDLFMGPNPDTPGAVVCPENCDWDGTNEINYEHLLSGLRFNHLLKTHGSQEIELDVMCPGFLEISRDGKTPIIASTEPVEQDGFQEAPPINALAEDDSMGYPHAEIEPFLDFHAKPISRQTLVGLAPPEKELSIEATAEERMKYLEYYERVLKWQKECEEKPDQFRLDSTPAMKALKKDMPFEIQSRYITEANIREFFECAVKSNAFQIAAGKSVDMLRKSGRLVQRICVELCLKSLVLIVVLDRNLLRPNEYQMYTCGNVPPEEYWYQDEYRGGNIAFTIMEAFVSALERQGILKSSDTVEFYADTAFRGIFREVLLRETRHGGDQACSAFKDAVSEYLSKVLNPLSDVQSALEFCTFRTKRFLRYHYMCFQEQLRKFATENITVRGRMLWLPSVLQDHFVNAQDICLLSVDPETGEQERYVYEGSDAGFVETRPESSAVEGREKRKRSLADE